jgi:Flp pilus assembly protein TadD
MNVKPTDADAANWDAVEEAVEQLQEGRFLEAIIELRRVILADAGNPYAFHFLGIALFESGENAAARDAFRAALRLAPTHLGARVGLSHALRLLGDPAGALREARMILRTTPKDADALHAAGLAQIALGEKEAARRDLSRFLETGPEYEAHVEVQNILQMLGAGNDDGEER